MDLISTRLRGRFQSANRCSQGPIRFVAALLRQPGGGAPSAFRERRAARRLRHLLRFECLEPRLSLSTTTLDFDGTDEPFYTTPNMGATISLAEVNARLAAVEIPISFHSANETSWGLRDCCGGNHFLLGNQSDGPGSSDGAADFYANFLESGVTRLAFDVGYFVNPASARLTVYTESISSGSAAELAILTPVGTQILSIDGSSQNNFYFQLNLSQPGRSFVLEISGNTTGPAVNRIEWDFAYVPGPATFGPLPTERGEWHQFRGDERLTGRATMHGNVTSPEILWTQFIGSRRTSLALSIDESTATTFPLPMADISMSEAERAAWEIGHPLYDLDGTGMLTAIAPSFYEKIGDFVPASPGLERVVVEHEPASTNGSVRFYTRSGGTWHQQWVSSVIPSVEYGPNIIVDDIDGDGKFEIVLTPWYNVYVLDLATGAIEDTESFNAPGSESGRPYGWFGAYDLDNDGRKELVVLGDFENKIGVVGWSGAQLRTRWTRLIEPGVEKKQTVFHPGFDPVADINGDGLPEIVVSIYNESGDERWHVVAFNGISGNVLLDLPDQYLTGLEDVDGDGNQELFVTASPQGPAPATGGDIQIVDFDGNVQHTMWSHSDAGFQTGLVQIFTSHVNSGAGTGRETLITGAIEAGNELPVFFTRQLVDEALRLVEVTAWRFDGTGGFVQLASAAGPNLEVVAARVGSASSPQILLAVEAAGNPVGQSIQLESLKAAVAESSLVGPSQTSAVVGRLSEEAAPTVIVGGSSEQLVAFQVGAWTGATSIKWTTPGRGEYGGSGNFQGQHGLGNVVLADLAGDGTLTTIAATQTADGYARIVALGPDGNQLWYRDFPFPGAPPEWNVGGLTTFKAGHFRDQNRPDVIVSLRQSTMHSDVYFLLDGETGAIVWTRDWGDTPGVGSHDRGAGGSQLAVYDWDGDGLDEAINIYPDVYYVLEGTGGNELDRNLANGAVYPSIWPQGGIPIVEDFLGNGTATVFHSGSLNVVGLLDDRGNPLWYRAGSFSQFTPAVLDFDGDGSLELYLDEVAYSAANGEQLFSLSLPGTPGPVVSADIDGDGRDEAIVTSANSLYIVGFDPVTRTGKIEWSMSFDSWLGMPVVADANGDQQLEIIVVGTSGMVYGIGQRAIPVPGDYNRDESVDSADYTVWRNTLHSTTDLRADGNGDSVVNQADYGVWKSHFDESYANSGSAAVARANTAAPGAVGAASPSSRLQRSDANDDGAARNVTALRNSTGLSIPLDCVGERPACERSYGSSIAKGARGEAFAELEPSLLIASSSDSHPFDCESRRAGSAGPSDLTDSSITNGNTIEFDRIAHFPGSMREAFRLGSHTGER